jgi:hypothetical protein
MWQYNSKTISVGRSWTDDNGITHPAVWNRWTPEFKTSIGLVWVDDPPPPEPYDDRFYWSANNPRSLEDIQVVDVEGNPVLDENGNQQVQQGLKSQWIERTKTTAHEKLKNTDWYVTRQSETGKAIPEEISSYRTSVRVAVDSIIEQINACTTIEEFMTLFDSTDNSASVINSIP